MSKQDAEKSISERLIDIQAAIEAERAEWVRLVEEAYVRGAMEMRERAALVVEKHIPGHRGGDEHAIRALSVKP